mmetsp:Transcript_31307/g.78568  ORF Transcript_31307/g.78568 Transcript_31307/m.78568 type:complete len:93 (-) Transcript_31307:43-321(-)|eukprot:CAMPEP_0177659052 /NCGR_PEP_ID=MMETSP0447-20121125/17219_1 /TAXON_ID=0 /ORGANISM="Stygamoeba regulata, Strain BSH-02190019" /LENGTH=92 /DNA_ID=CAMNT_0019163861 /DNA_START=381 /DNA_END=659 /DNA_ORIENTATION=-
MAEYMTPKDAKGEMFRYCFMLFPQVNGKGEHVKINPVEFPRLGLADLAARAAFSAKKFAFAFDFDPPVDCKLMLIGKQWETWRETFGLTDSG